MVETIITKLFAHSLVQHFVKRNADPLETSENLDDTDCGQPIVPAKKLANACETVSGKRKNSRVANSIPLDFSKANCLKRIHQILST